MNTKFALIKRILLVFVVATIISAFSTKHTLSNNYVDATKAITDAQFHDYVYNIVNGKGISQNDLIWMTMEAERRKSKDQSPSEYIETYMNEQFRSNTALNKAGSSNSVSIAAPGQSDLNTSVSCGQTALETVTSNTNGYYYAFAESCNGTFSYDSANVTGNVTVYVRAEARNSYNTAFILY